ncbi:hypothetical protein [Providencia rettgeri]|uniref:hypothetical protein n=1 Tax=Providencia rettgeri TaxID=587 RepID=UPI00141939DE|nr:hypothetical protein [Providencia rettgeri]NIH07047.1 hypothetical protein [Providencia rettgeri]
MSETEGLLWVYENLYPRIFYVWLLALMFVIQFTFSGYIEKSGDKNTLHLIIVTLKKKLLIAYLLITAFAFLTLYALAWKVYDQDLDMAGKYITLLLKDLNGHLFTLSNLANIIFIILVPIIISFIHRRYIKPKISSLVRKYRVSQTTDTMSDIRIENEKHKIKEFNPEEYYKDGYFFFGLNEKNKPVYKKDSVVAKNNIKILGATQTGKGVLQGVLLYQSIRKKWGTWFFDQKPDDFIFSIMSQTCKELNLPPPIVFDINEYRGISYEPFENGTPRERLSRLFKAFDLDKGGSDADFYKRKARTAVRLVIKHWNGKLIHLKELLSGHHTSISDENNEIIKQYADAVTENIDEWLSLKSIGSHGDKKLDIKELISNGSVVYILGNSKDKLIKAVNKVLLTEWVQTITKIKPQNHIYAAIDEVRFVISSELADSLATILSKNANISIAYQEREDLSNVENETSAISLSIKKGAETNTNITIIYKCGNETAEWIAKESGTIAKSLTKLEEVDTDGYGAENWKGRRMIGQEEEYFIPINTILSLPPRVGVMQTHGDLSTIIYSCWIDLKKGVIELPPIVDIRAKKQKTQIADIQQSDQSQSKENEETEPHKDQELTEETKPHKDQELTEEEKRKQRQQFLNREQQG